MTHSTEQRLTGASEYLEHALRTDSTSDARRAFHLVGLAQAELAGADLAAPPLRDLVRERLGALLVRDLVLMARAAADIATPAQDDRDVPASLLARTGYQVLLDAGVWPAAPLSDFHLDDVDEALADALAEADAVTVPAGIPAAHTWWRRA